MKDLLGQEVNLGDYVVGATPNWNQRVAVYKVVKMCPKTIKVLGKDDRNYAGKMREEVSYLPQGTMVKLVDTSVIPQYLKDIPLEVN